MFLKKWSAAFISILLLSAAAVSGNNYDSLVSQYLNSKADTVRYAALYRIVRSQINIENNILPPASVISILSRNTDHARNKNSRHFYGLLLGLKTEILIINHNLDLADQTCDSAIQIAGQLNESGNLGSLFTLKSLIYQGMNLVERMIYSIYKAVENHHKAGNKSAELRLLVKLGNLYSDAEQYELAKKTFEKCIETATDSIEAGLAALSIARNEIKMKQYSAALENINKGNFVKTSTQPARAFYFFFVKGIWLKEMNRKNEALSHLQRAEELARRGSLPLLYATTLCEISEIHINEKQFRQAKRMLDEARTIAYRENKMVNKIMVHRLLSEFFEQTGKPEDAMREYKIWCGMKDSLHQNEISRALVRMVKESEYNKNEQQRAEQQRIKDQIESQKLRRQKVIIYSSAAILLFIGFIAFLLYRGNRQQKKANKIISEQKQRSDDLLKNILPGEVAEELKNTGTSKGREYKEVTVLFTDFKNFSKLSEQLSAQQLVNEINFYYSTFDKIISRYGVEKIKTIGDSYMCAGGLPVENMTHPDDTVEAALDMRDFMQREKEKRTAAGLPFFEIRIGLHTGPVVAGIVGTRKFAYDIWGDTVNIASRMESSGEPGKVNISSTTYELLKKMYTCIHRGKVQAKNKGMIDMYFVERS